MQSVADLFDVFKGPSAVARILNVGTSTASEMKRRGSIPVEHWPALVDAAKAARVEGVSPASLMEMHARAKTGSRAVSTTAETAA